MSKEGKAGPVSETRKPWVLTLSDWVRGQEQEQCVAQRGLVMELCMQAKSAFLLYRKELSGGVPLPHCPDETSGGTPGDDHSGSGVT